MYLHTISLVAPSTFIPLPIYLKHNFYAYPQAVLMFSSLLATSPCWCLFPVFDPGDWWVCCHHLLVAADIDETFEDERVILPCKARGQEPENRYRQSRAGWGNGMWVWEQLSPIRSLGFLWSSGTEVQRRTKGTTLPHVRALWQLRFPQQNLSLMSSVPSGGSLGCPSSVFSFSSSMISLLSPTSFTKHCGTFYWNKAQSIVLPKMYSFFYFFSPQYSVLQSFDLICISRTGFSCIHPNRTETHSWNPDQVKREDFVIRKSASLEIIIKYLLAGGPFPRVVWYLISLE